MTKTWLWAVLHPPLEMWIVATVVGILSFVTGDRALRPTWQNVAWAEACVLAFHVMLCGIAACVVSQRRANAAADMLEFFDRPSPPKAPPDVPGDRK
jgi:hypothetical protein